MTDTSNTTFNPARRLHDLLTDFLNRLNHQKTPVEDRWRHVLGLEDADLGSLLLGYSEIVRLPGKTRAMLKSLDEHPDHLERQLAPLPPIESVFRTSPLGANNSTAYAQTITGQVMAQLDNAAMAIERTLGHAPARDRDNEVAASGIRAKLEAIRAEVAADPELDPDVRAYLLRHLSSLSDALTLYIIDGIAPVIDALDMMAGQDAREPEVAKRAKATKYWQKTQEAVRTLSAIVQIAARLGLPFGDLPALEAPPPTAIERSHDPGGAAGHQP